MSDINDTRRLRPARKPVFTDWRGRRRRVVIGVGIVAGAALAGWLVLIVAGVLLAAGSG
ncbi:hypothetical protein Aab01nite_63340 [Paractinoplanes abujensis]|uniref:Uncharacterized protein n=1 Tax=Paractinoplanes abujensis TaxID=882441 RepID=A0A7W7CQA8_9ACTN|nr:hypothetical protein [Actinoplanes abujensis]MBB4692757.1 hypothetical protein [Actinoplanes abujensis]GID22744.1 hypothetical protein Aab01nite_63340 [Actinoplanes abujensis]